MAKKNNNVKVISVRKPAKKKRDTPGDEALSALVRLSNKIDYQIGRYAFMAGMLLALVFAFIYKPYSPPWEMGIFLVLIGLVIGVINVTHAERQAFMVAAIALIVTNIVNFRSLAWMSIGPFLTSFIFNLTIIFAPAALLVAFETIWHIARDR